LAHRQFESSTPTTRADSSAAALAMSVSMANVFDDLLPWLEAELQRTASAAR
jgi:hypothetical protein